MYFAATITMQHLCSTVWLCKGRSYTTLLFCIYFQNAIKQNVQIDFRVHAVNMNSHFFVWTDESPQVSNVTFKSSRNLATLTHYNKV